jgi:hypothetical protein
VRRLALVAAATLVACGSPSRRRDPAPRDRLVYPTGLAVLDHRLLVASSNADLTYDDEAGGSVISIDPVPDPARLIGGVGIRSFAGELAVADPTACGLAAAKVVVPVRGWNVAYKLDVDDAGAVRCNDGCEVPIGSSDHGDPFAVGIACGPGVARAYVGYLRAYLAQTWIAQIDLLKNPGEDGYVRYRNFEDTGQARGFAYDASQKRLYVARTATGAGTTLRWLDLANECRIDEPEVTLGGCRSGVSLANAIPLGLELRSIALSSAPALNGVRRAYFTARIYDSAAAASAGTRIGDFDGLLLVVDLFEDAYGRLDLDIVDEIPIGYGAGDVRVLPARAGKRDVVAAIASDDGVVWIYDDETGARVAIGRSPETGAPLTGEGPFGLAVDPVALAGNVARVYVGSFRESFVTQIDVPLDTPELTAPAMSGTAIRRIGPQVTP